jgi:hypothetical protein
MSNPLSNPSLDPTSLFEAYRQALVPAAKVQEESLHIIERMGRYQYAVAGECLHWTLAQAKAAVTPKTPAEFLSRQMELATVLSERLRLRGQEFVSLATDLQTSLSHVVEEATAAVAEVTKKAA